MPDEKARTYAVDEVTLDLSSVEVAPELPMPPRVLLPAAMLGYECNRRGCCCGGWMIFFQPRDLVRLGRELEPDDRVELMHDVEFRVAPDPMGDQVVEGFSLLDESGRCRFLAVDGACRLHQRYGPDLLPDLCVDFPVATFTVGDDAQLVFDAVCPAVLDRLEPGTGGMGLVEHPAPTADRQLERRARHTRGAPIVRVGERELNPEQLAHVRDVVLASLERPRLPVWQHLLGIETAFSRLRRDQPIRSFRVETDHDPKAFVRHLQACIGAHGWAPLQESLLSYRRFVPWLLCETVAWEETVGGHLQDWEAAYEKWLAPHEEALRDFHARWLGFRFATPFGAPAGDLPRFAGGLTHRFATSLRYAAALAAALERPADLAIAKAAVGASEYFYRSGSVPPELMPWYESGA